MLISFSSSALDDLRIGIVNKLFEKRMFILFVVVPDACN